MYKVKETFTVNLSKPNIRTFSVPGLFGTLVMDLKRLELFHFGKARLLLNAFPMQTHPSAALYPEIATVSCALRRSGFQKSRGDGSLGVVEAVALDQGVGADRVVEVFGGVVGEEVV
ncbi:hypothetical protein LZ554_003679 [Drepanopeziza brunnea f. sp. 'monogermtubi']|nr:hypothetical protein LZ554_003679 [Drepanopeziza brunnea f. sp. 'monogermtubi']